MGIKNRGFTLVELIVVITILAVLWSIAFISFQWYSASARDSSRVTDIINFRKWIEIYMAEAGEYPMPDSAVSTSWNGHIANYKGVVWALTKENSRISKVILDPVTSEKYEYSISWNKKEYEVKYNLEWPQEYALVSQTYAYDFGSLRVVWNYNWVFARTDKNGFVAMPSLFSGETDVTIWNSTDFVIDNSKDKISFTPTLLDSTSTETLIMDLKTAYNSADSKVKETEKVVKILAMTASDEATQKEFEVDFLKDKEVIVQIDITPPEGWDFSFSGEIETTYFKDIQLSISCSDEENIEFQIIWDWLKSNVDWKDCWKWIVIKENISLDDSSSWIKQVIVIFRDEFWN